MRWLKGAFDLLLKLKTNIYGNFRLEPPLKLPVHILTAHTIHSRSTIVQIIIELVAATTDVGDHFTVACPVTPA